MGRILMVVVAACGCRWTPEQYQRLKDDLAAKGVTLVLVTPPPSNER